LGLHPVLDLTRHGEKGLFHIDRRLGRSLKKFDPEAVRKLLPLLRADDAFVFEIALVTDQQLVHILGRVAINLVEPLLHVLEAFVVCHVVDYDNTVCTAVVGRGNGPETLLAGGIPDLQLDCLAIQFDGANLEVNANGRYVRFSVGIIRES